jgi:hypothetical protein
MVPIPPATAAAATAIAIIITGIGISGCAGMSSSAVTASCAELLASV